LRGSVLAALDTTKTPISHLAGNMLRAVAFDHGDTLAEFRWDDGLWRRGVRAMLEAAGGDAAQTDRAAAALRRRLRERDPDDLAELDYAAAVADVLAELGVPAPSAAVRRGIEAEYRSWAPARHVHPQALALLDGVRARGLRSAVVANTFDPPGLFRADLRAQGIAERVDAVVLSCEVGWRKPHPAVYAAVAAELAAAPAEILFVGDRPADDIAGPAAAGMRTCLATWYRGDPGDRSGAGAVCAQPLDVLKELGGIVEFGSPGKI
jgi:HAD superfamily hydrolase (TIGR01509 family)